jgi:hypothetical protein
MEERHKELRYIKNVALLMSLIELSDRQLMDVADKFPEISRLINLLTSRT